MTQTQRETAKPKRRRAAKTNAYEQRNICTAYVRNARGTPVVTQHGQEVETSEKRRLTRQPCINELVWSESIWVHESTSLTRNVSSALHVHVHMYLRTTVYVCM